MVENLFTRPVDALPETIQVLELRHVANDRKPFTQIVVLNEPESRLCRFGIFPQIFALPNLHAAQFPILAAAKRKLDISLVTKDKLCLEALGRKQMPFAVILGLLLERHKVILPKLRRGGEV